MCLCVCVVLCLAKSNIIFLSVTNNITKSIYYDKELHIMIAGFPINLLTFFLLFFFWLFIIKVKLFGYDKSKHIASF